MNSLAEGFAARGPSEVAFGATVVSGPHFFYGRTTHSVHETFRVQSDDGRKLRIVDNVNIAPSVPVAPGDHIDVQGELVPFARGGPLVHWTHHDPRGLHQDGYIDLDGRRYA
jgi:hypothetical protein